MLSCTIALVFAAQATQAAAPAPPQSPSGAARAEAYYEFLQGRHLEGEGDVDAAIQAYRGAIALDPTAAEIQAELAGLYARQNRPEEAMTAAQAALRVDEDNAEANFVLGTIYASLARSADPKAGEDPVDKAIQYLEKARPTRRYDLGLALSLGRLYLRKGDYPRAIEHLKWVTDQESGAAEVWVLLAQAYEGAGQRAEAVTMLRQVVQGAPRYSGAWLMLGELLDRDQKFLEAADAYSHALGPNNSIEVRMRQASSLLNGDEPAAAARVLRQVVSDAPTNGGALYLLAEALRQQRNYDEAEATAKRLAALEPGQPRGALALALVYEEKREHQKIIDVLDPVIVKGGKDMSTLLPLLVRLGEAYQELGQYEQAISVFERAKSAAGDEIVFDAYLAQALVAAGRTANALAVIAAVRKTNPEDYRFIRLEAEALAKGGNADRAVTLLQGEADRSPQRLDLQMGLASFCVEHRRFDCALKTLDQADRQSPRNVLIAFQRGAMYERQQKFAEAEKAFRDALSRDPQHGPTLNYLGYMLTERKERLDEAVTLLQKALETDPWNGSYFDSLGWAYFMRGDLSEAHKYLSLAAERLPVNSVVQDHWGDVLWKQGDRDKAIAAWQQALKGDRDSIEPAVISRKIDEARRGRQ